ncbi:MAG: hypothetical protein MJ145_01490 [Clostridia bacterium]|nr:hypothetical protein [Clostridia bacterium]
MRFVAINKHKQWYLRVIVAAIALYFMWLEITSEQYIYLILAAFVFLAAFFDKDYVVDEKGFDVEFRLFNVFKMHDYWGWDVVQSLHVNREKAKPNVQLHIYKEPMVRTFLFSKKDMEKVLEFIELTHPEIRIIEDDPRARMSDEELLHRSELKTARNAKKKKK